ncbi:zinc-dependent alcohol dehydrogenase family protein [Lysobacter niabensis]|uniref:zinc-dependent alcohol dehydrogenase family protein n=1 Tax=Agrilutibacter niabensis TaxID=380628 RepID=UPI003622F8D4
MPIDIQAMVLHGPGEPLVLSRRALSEPAAGQVRIRVEACGVCRTDLHVMDGELPQAIYPIVPGHEVVGIVECTGARAKDFSVGDRVGVPWLAETCGQCEYCRHDRENLCDAAQFTGCTRDGGYATHLLAEANFCVRLDPSWADPVAAAPLLCAGLIGWRALNAAGDGRRLGIYGFGAAAHIVVQIARWQGRRVFAFTRPGDAVAQSFARTLGACWAGGSDRSPPEALDAAILFAPVGALVPSALQAVRKGGRVVCAGIHMSDIPQMPYRLLWGERQLVSVANLTRQDARTFFGIAAQASVRTQTQKCALSDANSALAALREGRVQGAAVLIPD